MRTYNIGVLWICCAWFCLLQRPRGRPKGSSKKVSKLVKDPNAPKRPATAYLLFCQEQRDKMKQRYPNLNFSELTRELGYKWSEMPDEHKRVGGVVDCPCCKLLVSACMCTSCVHFCTVTIYTRYVCCVSACTYLYVCVYTCMYVCIYLLIHILSIHWQALMWRCM